MTYDPKELLLPLSIYNNPPPIIDFIKKQRGGEDSVANTDSNQSAGSESSSTGTKDQPAESSPQNYNSEICVLVPQSDNSWTDTNVLFLVSELLSLVWAIHPNLLSNLFSTDVVPSTEV